MVAPFINSLADQKEMLSSLSSPLFFVCNDPLWALGLEKFLPNYHIVCIDDKEPLDYLETQGVSWFCLERTLGETNVIFRNSAKLLQHPLTQKFIEDKSNGQKPIIMPFKPSASLGVLCNKLGYTLASTTWELNKFFEDKLLFPQFLEEHNLPSVPSLIFNLTRGLYDSIIQTIGTPFVLQTGFGFAGSSTFIISSQKQWRDCIDEMEGRKVKVSKYIKGTPVTLNACATHAGTINSPACLQITGLPEYTTSWGGTCGTSWDLQLSPQITDKLNYITSMIGDKMYERGFRGIFGLDFVIEEETHAIYIIENNARIVASIPFYTGLQEKVSQPLLLAFHLLEVLGISYETDIQQLREQIAAPVTGSQLILRNVWGEPVTTSLYVQSGLYDIQENFSLKWIKPAHSMTDCGENQLIILPTPMTRIVNPAVEYARFRTSKPFLNNDDLTLLPWVDKVAKYLQQHMGIA